MPGRLFHRPKRFLTDQRGGVSVTLVLMIIPMIAALGMAAEGSSWFFIKRAMQNASDSAAIAAATNGCTAVSSTCYSTYVTEAKSVAKQFGFTDGLASVVVTATNTARCPDNTLTCYGVSIQKKVQVSLVDMVGFRGNTTVGGQPALLIASSSLARPRATNGKYCVTTLGTGNGDGITFDGGPKIDLHGCDVGSKTDALCTGGSSATIGHAYVATLASPPSKACGSTSAHRPGRTYS